MINYNIEYYQRIVNAIVLVGIFKTTYYANVTILIYLKNAITHVKLAMAQILIVV